MPADGIITRIAYRHGSFLNASMDKASEANERNAVALRLADGREIAFVQIAGLVARRIVCTLREGDTVQAGQRFRHHPLRQPGRSVSAGRRAPTGRRRSDHGRRRNRHCGACAMSGSPRPDWNTDGPARVSPIKRLRRLRLRARPRFKGPSFNRIVPNLMTLIGLCAGPNLDAVCAGGPLRRGGGGHRRCWRDRRYRRSAGSAAERHQPLWRGIRQPDGLLVLWRRPGVHAVSVVAAAIRRVRLHALPDLRGVHGATATARFNASLDSAPGPALAYNFFTGVPAPAGAGLVLFPLFLGLEAKAVGWDWLLAAAQFPLVCAVVLVGTALLLVSTLPIWSFKNFKVPHEYVLPMYLGAGTFAAVLVADPWAGLVAGDLIYLTLLPFSVRSFRRLKREAEEGREAVEAE